jgi:tetratricopeptide (TPR) repeat protein
MRRSSLLRPVATALLLLLVLSGCAALLGYSIEALMKQGIELLTQGKYDEALAKFQEVLKRDPQHWNAYLYAARAFIGKRAWTDALASARKAFELAPEKTDVVPVLADALLGGGRDALQRGQFADAARLLIEYVKLRPTDVQSLLDAGRQALAAGDAKSAIALLREYVRTEPGSVAAYAALGKAYWQNGEMADALGAFQRVLQLDPTDADALRFLRR